MTETFGKSFEEILISLKDTADNSNFFFTFAFFTRIYSWIQKMGFLKNQQHYFLTELCKKNKN